MIAVVPIWVMLVPCSWTAPSTLLWYGVVNEWICSKSKYTAAIWMPCDHMLSEQVLEAAYFHNCRHVVHPRIRCLCVVVHVWLGFILSCFVDAGMRACLLTWLPDVYRWRSSVVLLNPLLAFENNLALGTFLIRDSYRILFYDALSHFLWCLMLVWYLVWFQLCLSFPLLRLGLSYPGY